MTPSTIVLLFGMPRSGTSWIGKIFDSHPSTLYRFEPDRGGPIAALPFAPDLSALPALAPSIREFATALPNVRTTPAASTLPVFTKAYRTGLQHRLHSMSVFGAKAGSRAWRGLPVLSFANYDRADVRLVWKSVDSLGRIGCIARALENSRTVLLTRHPCAYTASLLRGQALGKFAAPLPSDDDGIIEIVAGVQPAKRRGLTADHIRRCDPIERLAWLWTLINEKAFADVEGLEHCTRLRHEDLCADPVGEARRVFTFAGLDLHPQTLEFIRQSTTPPPHPRQPSKRRNGSDGESFYGLFKNPVEAANKWRKQLTEEQIDSVYRVLRESDLVRLYPESRTMQLASNDAAV